LLTEHGIFPVTPYEYIFSNHRKIIPYWQGRPVRVWSE